MNRLTRLPKRPEITASTRQAFRRSQLSKGSRKLSNLAFSITTPKFQLRLDKETREVGHGADLSQSRGDGAPDRRVLTKGGSVLRRPAPARPETVAGTSPNSPREAQTFPGNQDIQSASLGKNPGGINFWDALGVVERLDFIELSDEQAFAAGDRLMEEGEQANHVVMISSGRVRVDVHENGRERTLAERGPGDLIGERAALEVSVRSATVVALEEVRALVVKTEDFAGFVSHHPAILRIVESQIYDRLTEYPADSIAPRARPLRGQHCTVLFTDVVGFADDTRNDSDRLVIRRATADMTSAALAPFWDACTWADRGDGLLIVIPPDIPTGTVLQHLMTILPAELYKHNISHGPSSRVQLRVAVTVGPVVTDIIGVSGDAIILAARMLDAPVFKKAIAEAGSALGVIASAFVYDMAIKHAGEPLDAAVFVPVQVKVKKCRAAAWMQVVNPD